MKFCRAGKAILVLLCLLAAPSAWAADFSAITSLPLVLALAFAGGCVLNLMPCVFPVLSIKALGLIQGGQKSSRALRLHGYSYGFGVLLSFLVLGLALLVLRAGGARIGWGFQFQSPAFVLLMSYLLVLLGLNLSGVFTVGASVMGLGSSLGERGGYVGSFFSGVLATLVATPCTAPFMGVAVGYALTQSPWVLLATLLSVGLGLACPYVLLSQWPLLQRVLPKPGRWMEQLKQALAWPMYLSALWLLWVLYTQRGLLIALVALAGAAIIGVAASLYGRSQLGGGALPRRVALSLLSAALLTAVVAGLWSTSFGTPAGVRSVTSHKEWELYTPARLQALRSEGTPVFLNMSATWCATCLANEQAVLGRDSVEKAFRDAGVVYLKGEWTTADQDVTAFLARFERAGIPLYVFFPRGRDATAVILPQILTPDIVLDVLLGKGGEPTQIKS